MTENNILKGLCGIKLTCAVEPSSSFTSSLSSKNIGNDVDNSACIQSTKLLQGE